MFLLVLIQHQQELILLNLIHDRVTVNWDDMNDVNCMVEQYRIRYREVGASAWSSKTMMGSGLCLFGLITTSKLIVGLTPSTTYEYYMKSLVLWWWYFWMVCSSELYYS